jgi:hypothetical protein
MLWASSVKPWRDAVALICSAKRALHKKKGGAMLKSIVSRRAIVKAE